MFQRFHEAKPLQEAEMSGTCSPSQAPPPPPATLAVPVIPPPKVEYSPASSNSPSNPCIISVPNISSVSSENISVHNASGGLVNVLSQPHSQKRAFSNFALLDKEAALQVPFRIKEENIRDISAVGPKDSGQKLHHHAFPTFDHSHNYVSLAQSAALDVLTSVSGSKSFLQEQNSSPTSYTILSSPNLVTEKSNRQDGAFECNICHQRFRSGPQLKNHYWRHTGVKPFKCEICQASFTQLTNLKTHQRIHSGERPFDCSLCGATFTQISNLKTHQKLHSGEKPYVCDICNARFTQQSNLKSHRLIHTGERPYKCDMCDATFVQSTHLRNHKRIHTNERPYGCEHCGASFRQLSNLRTHEKTHTGEKPFVCECGSAFAQKSNLKSHKLKLHQIDDEDPPTRRGRKANHGGIGPFICSECGAHFSAASNLKAHVRIHTGEKPFECSVCFMSFAQKSNLKAHVLIHSDVKPFSCPDCPSAFKQKANLRTHIIKKHNGSTINFSPFLPTLMRPPNQFSHTLLHLSNPVPSSSVRTPPTDKMCNSDISESKRIGEPIVQIKEGRVIVRTQPY